MTGDPSEQLQTSASEYLARPDDESTLRALSSALFAALPSDPTLSALDERDGILASMIKQADCSVRPLILAHEAASHITSGKPELSKSLSALVIPIAKQIFDDRRNTDEIRKNALILLLTLRQWTGEYIPEADIKAAHIEWFPRFEQADFALPYSVMFNPDYFGQNRADLVSAYPGDALAGETESRLSISHVLLLDWLQVLRIDPASNLSELRHIIEESLPISAEDRASLFALLLRYWRPDCSISTALLREVGFSTELNILEAFASRRDALPQLTSDAVGKFGKTSYQARSALKNKAAEKIPALAPMLLRSSRRPKVALCLSGQLRGYEAAWPTLKDRFLAGADVETFVHSWTGVGRSDAQPFRYVLPFEGKSFPEAYRSVAVTKGYDETKAVYPSLFKALSDGALVSQDALKAYYKTDHVVLEDDTSTKFDDFSNQDKMHYKIEAAYELARNTAEFDLYIRMRPDLPVTLRGFDWPDMKDVCQNNPVLFAEKAFGVHYGNPMIGDQCAIASAAVMDKYARTFSLHKELGDVRPFGCPTDLTGHVSLAFSAWSHGVSTYRVPMKFGALQDAAKLRSIDIAAALRADNVKEHDPLWQAVQSDLS